ncbi:MAG TPA: hypothetical protein VEL75_09725 [Candidatus Methylomirabilis sp.]|nr:hypothetical protein [Candidatus Methylomirabilis sp.]
MISAIESLLEAVYRVAAATWRAVDWQGAGAVATFLVAALAVIPIWRDARRRRAVARGVREEILMNLRLLQPRIAAAAADPSVELAAVESEAAGALRLLIGQAHLLEADEARMAIGAVAGVMPLLAPRPHSSPAIEDALVAVNEAISTLERRSAYRPRTPIGRQELPRSPVRRRPD